MGKIIDLTGQKFGRLTVLEDVGRTKHKKVIWKCLCDCGSIVNVRASDLQSGHTKSCGCLSQESRSKTHYKDLTGQKFGRLTVLEDVGRKGGLVLWKCLCDCGTTVDVVSSHLSRGNTQSCGCLQKERTSKARYINLMGQKFGRLTVLEDAGRDKYGRAIWRCQCDCGVEKIIASQALQRGTTQSCGCYHKELIRQDLTGQIFGRLTVLEIVGKDRQDNLIWRCQCECGQTTDVIGNSLTRGNTLSCGCYHKERTSEAHSGDKHHNWKGGITPLYSLIRNCPASIHWRDAVFARDSYTCRVCGDKRGGNLHAHHLKLFSLIMKEHNINTMEEALACAELWDINNGLTICRTCHEIEHYGV